MDIPCFSFEQGYRLKDEYELIVSIDSASVREQLDAVGWSYKNAVGVENNFFSTDEQKQKIDAELMRQYDLLKPAEYTACRRSNWFRKEFESDDNHDVVRLMEKNDRERLADRIESFYSDNIIYFDEYVTNRPGMRLICNIIKKHSPSATVCDIACGHGQLLKALSDCGYDCFGVEASKDRCVFVRNEGIVCNHADTESTDYEDNKFDYVICLECLEHIQNPFKTLAEIGRILKPGGKVFVTVPYGMSNGSDNHVRFFYEQDLYAVAKRNGFTDIKIMDIPYLNWSEGDNIFMEATLG